MLEPLDAISQQCRVFEVCSLRGGAHLSLELAKRMPGATLEKSVCDVDGLPVLGRGWPATTGRQTRVELCPDAAWNTPARKDLELVVEEDGGRRRAVAELEHVSEFADSSSECADSRKGTVVGRAVISDARDWQHSRRPLTRDLHERVDALALVSHVEARLPLLDQLHLMDERREFIGYVFPRDPSGLVDQLPCLFSPGGSEVRQESSAHVHGLADIQQLIAWTVHAVNARPNFCLGTDVFAKGRVRAHAARGGAFVVSSEN